MATRLFGVVMNDNVQLWRNLAFIPGIGQKTAFKVCQGVGLMPKTPWSKVTSRQREGLQAYIESKPEFGSWWKVKEVGPEYRRMKQEKREALIAVGSYRGLRLAQGLPVHGQRTRSHAKTSRKLKGKC